MTFLPKLGRAMKQALQWRLLLWWVLLTLLPTLVVALPVWQMLSTLLDHTIHAAEWAQHWDMVMLIELGIAARPEMAALAGSGIASIVLLLVLIPLLNGLFIAASRSSTSLRMGELLQEGLRQYWRMLRLMLIALIPIGVSAVVMRLLGKSISHYSERATLASQVEHLRWAAIAFGAIVLALMNATVDAARASLALEPHRRSAFLAWWRGLKLVLRRPVRSAVLYLTITAIATIALAVMIGMRVRLHDTGLWGLILGLMIAQITTAIVAWMHYARLFGMLELTRALKPSGAA